MCSSSRCRGQGNFSLPSITLYQTTNPLRSHHRILIRSRRLPVKMNSAPLNGSAWITSCTNAAKPDRCFLMSIGARCKYTRSIVCSGRSMAASGHELRQPGRLWPARTLHDPAVRMLQPAHRANRSGRCHAHRQELARRLRLLGHLLAVPENALAGQSMTDPVQALRTQPLSSAVLRQRQLARLRPRPPPSASRGPRQLAAPALLEDALDTAVPVPLARSASSSCSPSTATCRNTQHHLPKSTWEECGCSSPYLTFTERSQRFGTPNVNLFGAY